MIELTPSGISSYIKARLQAPLPTSKAAPVTVGTGSGTPAIIHPPTVQAPPSAVASVEQQISTSTQLMENTVTTAGIGNNQNSLPVTRKLINGHAYTWLAALVIIGIFAVMAERK